MSIPRTSAQFALAAALTLAALPPAQAADPVPMAAHRALYTLTLDSARGDVSAVQGSMAYEVADVCDAWATRQRLTLLITNRDGQDITLISDYATLESKDGLSMQFRMRQTTDSAVTDQVEGTATLEAPGGPGTVHYTVRDEKDVPLPKGTLFPMKHTERIVADAMAGQRFLAVPIFDGTGDHGAQDSFVVMSGWGPTPDPPYPALAGLQSGHVHVSFFDRQPKPTKDKVEGTPDYEVSMRYYANGVADDLHMDFGDFVMSGKLTQFTELKPHC